MEAKHMLSENTWYWDNILYLTAGNASELIRLETLPVDELARCRLHKLYTWN